MRAIISLLFLLPSTAALRAQTLEPLNKDLPGWIKFTGEYRNRFEGFSNRSFQPENDDHYSLSRARLNVRLQPAKWLKLFGQAQDSHVFGNSRISDAPPYQNRLDLRQAWGEFGDSDAGPLALRVGRQEINVAEERLVGSSNWGNTSRSFDAVKLTGRFHKLRMDIFASSVVTQVDDAWDRHLQGDDLHGITGVADLRGTRLEPFVLWHLAPRVRSEAGVFGKLDHKTYGVRWSGKMTPATEFVMEVAGQNGNWGADSAGAWAGHWRVIRTLSKDKRVPRLRMEYDYAQGDSNPRDGRHETFELLYPTPHDKLGLADQVGWKNIHHFAGIAEWKPTSKWTLQTKYHNWLLASATDALYNAGGTLIVRDATGRSGRHVGQEMDFQAMVAANKQVQVGAGLGHIFPGGFLKKATPGASYTFPYVMLTWAF